MRRALITLVGFFFATHQIDAVAQSYGAGACSPIPNSQTCADATPCKLDSSGKTVCLSGVSLPSGALSVPQTCWQYNYQYSCATVEPVNTCTTASWYNANTCSVVSQSCSNKIAETGVCSSYNYTYKCQTSAATSAQQMVCSNNVLNQAVFPTPDNKNNSFAITAAALEVAREVQVYANCGSSDSTTCALKPLFSGVNETCRKGYFGLKNCCNSAPGGETNSQAMNIAMGAGSKAVMYAGRVAVDKVSPYVFDTMYQGGTYAAGLTNSLDTLSTWAGSSTADYLREGAKNGTNFSASGISAYGFTYGSSTQVVGGGTFGGNVALSGGEAYQAAAESYQAAAEAYSAAVETGEATAEGLAAVTQAGEALDLAASEVLLFNPYTFAFAIAMQFAIQAIMEAMACTQEEQMLSMHKGSNLSVFTGETCTNKIPIIGTCIEYTDSYCSFNSLFGKIINQQGKAQLGLNFSNCSGLTVTQIGSLDFSKMDLSELTAQVIQQAQAGVPSSPQIQTNYQPIIGKATSGSAQSATSGTGYK